MSPWLSWRSERRGGVLTVGLSGELDAASAPRLYEALRDGNTLPLRGATSVVFDLSDLSFLDAGGLEMLELIRDVLHRLKRPVLMVQPSRAVGRLLEIAGAEHLVAESVWAELVS